MQVYNPQRSSPAIVTGILHRRRREVWSNYNPSTSTNGGYVATPTATNLLAVHLDNIVAGKLSATPQDNEKSTYAPMISQEDGRLNWQQTSAELDRRVRAMTPWPGAFTTWQGEMLKILAGRVAHGRLPIGQPGTVVAYEEGAAVLTADGALVLEEVQLAGKRAPAVADFLRGYATFIGSAL